MYVSIENLLQNIFYLRSDGTILSIYLGELFLYMKIQMGYSLLEKKFPHILMLFWAADNLGDTSSRYETFNEYYKFWSELNSNSFQGEKFFPYFFLPVIEPMFACVYRTSGVRPNNLLV